MSRSSATTPADTGAILVVRRVIRASRERIFAAWTEPAQLQRWWGPGPVTCPDAEVDLRVGGRYRLGNRMPDGSLKWIAGVFEVVEPPGRLVYSWGFGDDAETIAASERVIVRFASRGDATEVIVRHERIPTPDISRQHRDGWQGCLDGLADYLAA